MLHLAWLNATPDEATLSRRAEFERDQLPVVAPDCDASYIIDYLFDLGITLGDDAITHVEIRAWMENTGIRLTPWEARTIKQLSQAYLSGYQQSTSQDAETPWTEAPYYMSARWRKAMKLKQSIRKAAEI